MFSFIDWRGRCYHCMIEVKQDGVLVGTYDSCTMAIRMMVDHIQQHRGNEPVCGLILRGIRLYHVTSEGHVITLEKVDD